MIWVDLIAFGVCAGKSVDFPISKTDLFVGCAFGSEFSTCKFVCIKKQSQIKQSPPLHQWLMAKWKKKTNQILFGRQYTDCYRSSMQWEVCIVIARKVFLQFLFWRILIAGNIFIRCHFAINHSYIVRACVHTFIHYNTHRRKVLLRMYD